MPLTLLAHSEDLPQEIRYIIEGDGDEIVDLHVWQLGPGHHGAILSIRSPATLTVAAYKAKLSAIHDLSHVTVEVQAA
ncbi:hypothetical protein ACQKP1_12725 [Allorhizobium sp. NPDC080224]|mgnify:FL=1|uniref:hypothetical protein n=1 Tax=Allorhizobium sp. NPDC080224 TaxID=3390547 RepID=UPI003D05D3D5